MFELLSILNLIGLYLLLLWVASLAGKLKAMEDDEITIQRKKCEDLLRRVKEMFEKSKGE